MILWVMMVTGLIDYAVGSEGLVTFVLRLLAFPVMLAATWRLARKPYLRLLHTVDRGWWLFAAMTGLFYVTLGIMGGVPTNLRRRPDDMPAAVMVLILLPLTYVTIFRVLHQQEELFDAKERQRTFEAQTAMIERRAEELGIRVEARLAIPEELPVPAAELSTVFANALENMIRAVRDLPAADRRIVCKCVTSPRLMLEFSNPCPEGVKMGPDGIPMAKQDGHGLGTRSIVAFAEKHSAVYVFRMEDGWFKLQLAL